MLVLCWLQSDPHYNKFGPRAISIHYFLLYAAVFLMEETEVVGMAFILFHACSAITSAAHVAVVEHEIMMIFVCRFI